MTNASGRKNQPPEPSTTDAPVTAAVRTVRAYHQRSKHRFEAYAPGPGTLDWDAQPDPFRHFEGAACIALQPLAEALRDPDLAAALQRPFADLTQSIPPVAPNLAALSVLLQLSLGITAWKSYGPDRWAVRANPSSGNLHPVEGYLFLCGIAGLTDGLYHYCPDTHTLECRAEFDAANSTPQLLVGLSSVMWREAWKYGERAFRYCQLDTGHAVGAFRYAAALLGWPLAAQRMVGTDTLAQWLGLDRYVDFASGRLPHTEQEEAEILLSLTTVTDLACLQRAFRSARWHGKATAIDRHPMYQWPAIAEVAAASHHGGQVMVAEPLLPETVPIPTHGRDIPAARIILQRRSAQRFDARHVMSQQDFFNLLAAVLPTHQPPWDALATPPRICLVLFVHRVEGLQPGLYLLPRTASMMSMLNEALDARFLRSPVDSAPPYLGLQLLTPAPLPEMQRVARSLNCHQDIASNACFALGMLAEFDTVVTSDPAAYRDLYREAGLIGQVLYLQAEACGLRGTGIGCYFDDPFHELLGLDGERFQSLYHFTVGLPLEDPRIETSFPFDLGAIP